MKEIRKIKLFANDNEPSQKVALFVRKKFEERGFLIVDDDFDLGIAIGGDGAFLRMIKNSNFCSDCYYIGVNTGTLGFAQEVSAEQIDSFVQMVCDRDFKVETIGIEEISITTADSISKHFALNEMVIRDQELNTTNITVKIDGVMLEEYAGDGLLIATSFGSTAYNLSFGGSIVYNTFHTLQITPIAPLNNKSYRNLLNSVIIPDNRVITLLPRDDKKNLLITLDGDNYSYSNVEKIETFIDQKFISILRMKDYDFSKKICDKFLK